MHFPRSALLLVLLSMACATSSTQPPGASATPMSLTCNELPTVEECKQAAIALTNSLLRECVLMQCGCIRVNCGDNVKAECKARSDARDEPVAGYVERKGQTPQAPRGEIAWCEVPLIPSCRTLAMVHELAHSCGWRHYEGGDVPGNNGRLSCK
jgi:hypothetical protein